MCMCAVYIYVCCMLGAFVCICPCAGMFTEVVCICVTQEQLKKKVRNVKGGGMGTWESLKGGRRRGKML